MSDRTCTCLGTCRGAQGLAPGWRCALEPKKPDPRAVAYLEEFERDTLRRMLDPSERRAGFERWKAEQRKRGAT